MLEWLVRLECKRQELRRTLLSAMALDERSHFAIAGYMLLCMLFAWPAVTFVVVTPIHAFFLPWDLLLVGSILLGIFLLFTGFLAPVSLIFF